MGPGPRLIFVVEDFVVAIFPDWLHIVKKTKTKKFFQGSLKI